MASLCPTLPRPVTAQAWLSLHAGAGVLCLVVADWLFYKHAVGISFPLYLLFLALVCAWVNPVRADTKELFLATLLLLFAVAPSVYDFNVLSLCFGLAGLGVFAQAIRGARLALWQERLRQCWLFVWIGYGWLPRDLYRINRLRNRRKARKSWSAGLIVWVIPLLFGSIFLVLFAAANPVIADFLRYLDPSAVWRNISFSRFLFWIFILGLIWPFLHLPSPRRRRQAGTRRTRPPTFDRKQLAGLFNQAVLLRSLLLFNAIFLVQTSLDIAYLWGGLRLPGNLTYADYAHRGAYPLCCTALLAAGFVLAASPNLDGAGASRFLRTLLLLWIGQNLMLVVSSLLRLDLYVAAYSLTGLRIAAFLWMGLVGLGLILICLKIYRRKSDAWLIGVNALAACLTLYLCCFINFDLLIADYNIAHASSKAADRQSKLDEIYLLRLGCQATPAIDAYIKAARLSGRDMDNIERMRTTKIDAFLTAQEDWRAFGVEAWMLHRYLDKSRASATQTAP